MQSYGVARKRSGSYVSHELLLETKYDAYTLKPLFESSPKSCPLGLTS